MWFNVSCFYLLVFRRDISVSVVVLDFRVCLVLRLNRLAEPQSTGTCDFSYSSVVRFLKEDVNTVGLRVGVYDCIYRLIGKLFPALRQLG